MDHHNDKLKSYSNALKTHFYSPRKQLKIWLSTDPSCFLNMENQCRLIKMRTRNPLAEIYFIYDSRLLNAMALTLLNLFCEKYHFYSIDAHTQHRNTEMEQSVSSKQLMILYEDELEHMNTGGNPAILSDLLRCLDWVLALEATYSDLDREINTRALHLEWTPVKSSILWNVYDIIEDRTRSSIMFNNDMMAVVNFKVAQQDGIIQKIQTAIYQSCTSVTHSFYEKIILQQGSSGAFVSSDPYGQQTEFSLFFNKLKKAWQSAAVTWETTKKHSPVFVVRKLIYAETENLEQFNAIYQLNLSQQRLEHFRSIQLRHNVLFTTGPNLLRQTIYGHPVVSPEYFETEVKPSSLRAYVDSTYFPNCLGYLGIHRTMYNTMRESARLGRHFDNSWLPDGARAVTQREETMHKAARTLVGFFRTTKRKKTLYAFGELGPLLSHQADFS